MRDRTGLELLAPAGSNEMLEAAVKAGADAVYLGVGRFNARNRAKNFDLFELKKAIDYSHVRNVKIYLALNILIKDIEIKEACAIALEAWHMGVDGIITQDIGLSSLLLSTIKGIRLHASTQMTIFNSKGCELLKKFGFKRVVLARELSKTKIQEISDKSDIELEIFVHGSLCVSYSGQCLFSSMVGGRSGNRGGCAQPCRQRYSLVDRSGKVLIDQKYLLSTKDLITIDMLNEIIELNVTSMKIEGRMKDPYYVALVTDLYKRAINQNIDINTAKKELQQMFSRGGGTNGYLKSIKDDELMCGDTPSQKGIYLGRVMYFKSDKMFVLTELPISVGDTVDYIFDGEQKSLKLSKVEVNGKLVKYVKENTVAGLGHLNYEVPKDSKVFRRIDTKLIDKISESIIKDDVDIEIRGEFSALLGKKPTLKVFESDKKAFFTDDGYIVQKALKRGTTSDDIKKSLEKTTDTPFKFSKITINKDDDIYIPLSVINKMRREVLLMLEETKKINREFKLHVDFDFLKINKRSAAEEIKLNIYIEKPELFDYTGINNIELVFLPIEYLDNDVFFKKPEKIVLFLPQIEKDEERYEKIISKAISMGYKRFLVKNLGQFKYFDSMPVLIYVDYSLNTYNSYTLDSIIYKNVEMVCLSPELSIDDIAMIRSKKKIEVIGYGNMKLMTLEHSIVLDEDEYYLRDERENRDFRVLYDKKNQTTSIYNCNKLYMADKQKKIPNSCVGFMRLMFIDESAEFIEGIINKFVNKEKSDEKITYGHFFEKERGIPL